MKALAAYRRLSYGLLPLAFGACDLLGSREREGTSTLALSPAETTLAVANTAAFTVSGGVPPYTFSLAENSGQGQIDTATGAYTAPASATSDVVRVTDALGNVATASVRVNAALSLTLSTSSILTGRSLQVLATGGVAPYTYTLSSGGGHLDDSGNFTPDWSTETSVVLVTDSLENTASIDVTRTAGALQLGTSEDDAVFGAAIDSQGALYVVGTTSGAFPGQTSSGGLDAFVAKLSAEGALVWAKQFGSTGTDRAVSLVIDSSDHLYLVGEAGGALLGNAAIGNSDAFVASYDSSGTLRWSQQFGTSSTDSAMAVAVDSVNGGVYVTGYTYGSLGAANAGAADYFLRRLSTAGATTWTAQSGTTGSDLGRGVTVDATGYVYITGNLPSTAAALHGVAYPAGITAPAFVIKYDAAGTRDWTALPDTGASTQVIGQSLVTDRNGGLYVTFQDTSNADLILGKFAQNTGAETWQSSPTSTPTTTSFSSTVTLDSSSHPIVVSSTYLYNTAAQFYFYRAVAAKFHATTGAEEWVTKIGDETSITFGTGVAMSPNGTEPYVFGYTSGVLGVSSGGLDFFAAKLDSTGVLK